MASSRAAAASAARAATLALAVAAATGACSSKSVHPSSPAPAPGQPPAAVSPTPGPTASRARSALTTDLDAILAAPDLAHGTWGVVVRSAATGETLYTFNPQKLLMPASNMKIVTVAVAAEKLGWDYRYETKLLAVGRSGSGAPALVNGVLEGDLVVVGSGDPSIGLIDGSADRVFGEWAAALSALGVRSVDGRIVGDDNAFEDQELGFGWSWDDLVDDYAAGVGALQFNEGAVAIVVTPGAAAGDPVSLKAAPDGFGVDITLTARTGPSGSATSLTTRRLPGSSRLTIGGTIGVGAAPATLTVSVDNPTLFFVQALKKALAAKGIDVRGPAVDVDDVPNPPVTAAAQTIAVARSAPLSTLAVRLMKISQNQYAETFLKTMGAGEGRVASVAAGRAAALDILARWGVPSSGLILRDGSGLTRYDYVTADAIATILLHVSADARLREPFEASLPIAGRDGTAANRMKGTAAAGNAIGKTGSMSNVRSFSGYVTTADGERLVFAIIANNFETEPAVVNRATDAIIVRLASARR